MLGKVIPDPYSGSKKGLPYDLDPFSGSKSQDADNRVLVGTLIYIHFFYFYQDLRIWTG
jgi:hypothetical protein